jgi:hypothetical protein
MRAEKMKTIITILLLFVSTGASAAAATSRAVQRLPRSDRADQHRRLGQGLH